MRALLAAIRCHKGEVERNLAAHLGLLTEAQTEGCELVPPLPVRAAHR